MFINRWMDTEIVVHIYHWKLLSLKIGHIWVIFSEVVELKAYCTKWIKKDKYCILTRVWNLERWYWWTYLGAVMETDLENRLVDSVGGVERSAWKRTSPSINREPVGICCVTQGARPSTLRQPGGVGWAERYACGSRGGTCTPADDSCWCMAETSTIL